MFGYQKPLADSPAQLFIFSAKLVLHPQNLLSVWRQHIFPFGDN
jgi:hypothetical protein